MGCWGNRTDHNGNHSDRLTAIPLTRYRLKRIRLIGAPFTPLLKLTPLFGLEYEECTGILTLHFASLFVSGKRPVRIE